MYRDDEAEPALLVCQVGSTRLTYQARAVDDLAEWLGEQGGWVPLGSADEGKDPAPGTVEEFGRSTSNPVGGWYGMRKGYRGRFGMYLPPLLEELGLAGHSRSAEQPDAREKGRMSMVKVVRYRTKPGARRSER